MRPATEPDCTAQPAVKLAAVLALIVAGLLLAVWLWSRICRFPSIPWNDMRLAPTIALAQGWPVYPTATEGTISTWMYGPLPLLFFWPASWASSAWGALMIAAVLNVALTLVPLALVCFTWPAPNGGAPSLVGRASAFLLCLALWPELHYSVLFSDNLAVAGGLLGNLLLVRARSSRELWLAAIAATAAVGCKQIALGIPLAQVLWLGLTVGRTAAWRHVLRCVVAGAVIGAGAIAGFGWEGLWFTLVETPGGIGWAPAPWQRLLMVAPDLALELAGPAVVMIFFRRAFAQPALLLPALAWICALPLGIAGMMKLGGWTNSIHSFVLWLPAVLATALAMQPNARRLWGAVLAAAVVSAGVASRRVLLEPALHLRPQVADYRQAAEFAKQNRGAIWFPVHPLVTLYSEGRYYHDEDGLYVRMSARKPLSERQAAGHLPSALRVMAFRNDWTDWGIARRMLPPNTTEQVIGNWTLRSGGVTPVKP